MRAYAPVQAGYASVHISLEFPQNSVEPVQTLEATKIMQNNDIVGIRIKDFAFKNIRNYY
jgi:ppGpp synthetase/RelA/SpoT-type nucleotidyltranferase